MGSEFLEGAANPFLGHSHSLGASVALWLWAEVGPWAQLSAMQFIHPSCHSTPLALFKHGIGVERCKSVLAAQQDSVLELLTSWRPSQERCWVLRTSNLGLLTHNNLQFQKELSKGKLRNKLIGGHSMSELQVSGQLCSAPCAAPGGDFGARSCVHANPCRTVPL